MKKAAEKKTKNMKAGAWEVRRLGDGSFRYDDALNEDILNHFITLELLTKEQKQAILKHALDKGINIAEVILSLRILGKTEVARVFADYFKTTHVSLKGIRIEPETAMLIPEEVAKNDGLVAYSEDMKFVYIAMVDPSDVHFIKQIRKRTGKHVVAQYALPSEIRSALKIYAQGTVAGFQQLVAKATENINKLETLSSISSILDTIVLMAYYRKASDIHIEPFENEIRIRFRVDGVLSNVAQLPTHFLDTMVNHIKVLSKLRTDEHNSAQDGRFKIIFDDAVINFRVSILPSYFGEKLVMRLLSSESQELSLTELGYSHRDIEVIERNIRKTQGMNLVTGPTGSGKTTTLYSILSVLNKESVNISTIEDPIEYGIYGLNQVQVNLKTNLNFADGLRALLRQDPDIVMIGEIRDLDTAKISAHASLTGHLILATLHTNSASLAPLRLVQMGLDPYLILSTLNMIVAQRLVRKICQSCISSYRISEKEVATIGERYFRTEREVAIFQDRFAVKDAKGLMLFKGRGCEECDHSGYLDRTVVAEVLEVNQIIRDLIVNEASREEIESAALKNGMRSMLEDGLDKVFDGHTTLEELFRVINQ